MTTDQQQICLSLGNVKYLPGSFDKRFANGLRDIAKQTPEKELSEKQHEWMFRLLYKYRKQIPKTYELHKDNPYCRRKEKRPDTKIKEDELPY